jgi:hypothetical protein
MINNDIDALYLRLARVDHGSLRRLMARLDEMIDGRIDEAREWLVSRGWVEVEAVPNDAIVADDKKTYLPDGREVMPAQGKLWVLSQDEHARRLAVRMDRSREPKEAREQPISPATCAAVIDGQLCGGELTRKPVCPRCALGKHGVSATLTCDVCGTVTAEMMPR